MWEINKDFQWVSRLYYGNFLHVRNQQIFKVDTYIVMVSLWHARNRQKF